MCAEKMYLSESADGWRKQRSVELGCSFPGSGIEIVGFGFRQMGRWLIVGRGLCVLGGI